MERLALPPDTDFAIPQNAVDLGNDLRGIVGRRHAQQVVLLEILRRKAAQPLPDLIGEPVQICVAIHVQARQQLHQVKDIRDHRRVEAGLRLVQTVHHVRNHVPEPPPQIFSPARQ